MATNTKANANTANTKPSNTEAKPANPFAVFAKAQAKAEETFNKAADKLACNAQKVVSDSFASFDLEPTKATTDLYSLLVSIEAGDSLAKASGEQLGDLIQSMIEAYHAGDTQATQPIIEASFAWITLKTDGQVKTANIPNKLRMAVKNRGGKVAEALSSDYRLTLSTGKDEHGNDCVIVKQSEYQPKESADLANKALKALVNLIEKEGAHGLDKLAVLTAGNAQVLEGLKFVTGLDTAPKSNLDERLAAAQEAENRLSDQIEKLAGKKGNLVDRLNDLEDELQANEQALTAEREKLEAKTTKAGEKRLAALLEANQAIADKMQPLKVELEKQQSVIADLDKTYVAQVGLVKQLASLGMTH